MTNQRRIGSFTVSSLGLGGMPLSMREKDTPRDRAIATVHAALDAGITLIDTADIYAPSWDTVGHNESLIAEALAAYTGDTSRLVIATKGGITRAEGEVWGRDGSPAHLRAAAEASRERLGVDTIDLYYWHRPDRTLPYAQSVEALAQLKADGLIAEIGVSNASLEELAICVDVLGEGQLAAVQNEFSPRFNHTSYPELRWCAEHGVAFVPWSPLGGTSGGATAVGERFAIIGQVADAHGVSPQQVTLAWELALGEHVIPIPGASRPESIIDSALAIGLELTTDDLAALNDALLPRR
ncbi:MAG: aldo/keto reductase [Propioniciclava sp.]|uniref:aldo/keto reductase n=1 Tax=Propioniciclava sp. TaxID=2038686 RepID=UPI0039E2C64E